MFSLSQSKFFFGSNLSSMIHEKNKQIKGRTSRVPFNDDTKKLSAKKNNILSRGDLFSFSCVSSGVFATHGKKYSHQNLLAHTQSGLL